MTLCTNASFLSFIISRLVSFFGNYTSKRCQKHCYGIFLLMKIKSWVKALPFHYMTKLIVCKKKHLVKKSTSNLELKFYIRD